MVASASPPSSPKPASGSESGSAFARSRKRGAEPSSRKERSRALIVEAASRAIRRDGYAGVGVADVMREAGLTHGGFYAHFASRDALLVAAIEHAGRRSAEAIAGWQAAPATAGESPTASMSSPFRTLVERYLADDMLRHPENGCPVAALCSEMPRQAADVRRASTQRVRALVRYVASVLPAGVDADQAPLIAATLVGSLQLARAIGSPDDGFVILAGARRNLLERYEPHWPR